MHALPRFLDWLARENARAVRQHRPPVNIIDYSVMVPKRAGRPRAAFPSWSARWSPTRAAPWRGTCPDRTRARRTATMAGFLIRDIAPEDLDDLQKAAVHLDSVNLPDDRERAGADHRTLAAVVRGGGVGRERAGRQGSLLRVRRGRARQRPGGRDVDDLSRSTAAGSAPHVYFDVLEEERYSETLDRHFAHRVLRIGYNYKGLTEIGGLVRAAGVSPPPRAARAAADVGALPLHRAPPRGVPRRGAVRADAAARGRRHQPAVGVAGAEVHRPHATRRPIGCRRTTRSSSARCFRRIRCTRRCCRRTCRS